MSKPNVVIVYCDDLGYGDLGCYGSSTAKTPHLDELARTGVRFTNWYTNSPVCSPSRAALLTGNYPARTGVRQILSGKRGTTGLSTEDLTLGKLFKQAGYVTGLCGKWHLGTSTDTGPNAHGFEQFYGFLTGCVDYYSHISYWVQNVSMNPVHDLWHNGKEIWENGAYLTEWITGKAVDFIETNADTPFILYVPYNAPHYPMHAPKRYLDRFPDLPPDRRIMAAMIAAVDDGVGEIVRTLKRIGKYTNTVIFFSSDNGPSTESRNYLDGTEDLYYGGTTGIFRGHKGSLFEGGIREPAIFSFPAAVQGDRICDEIGMMMDIVPTLAGLAGVSLSVDDPLDGTDMMPVIAAGAPSPHERVFWEYGNQRAVREGRWKLMKNGMLDFKRGTEDPLYLSDLDADPGERVNLKGSFPEVAARLERALSEWEAAMKI